MPLLDCAPLAAARELGLFEKQGLSVQLSREAGWATIRDKILHGELEAAHAVAPMVVAATYGLGSIAAECVTGLVLSLEGNGVTVARALAKAATKESGALATAVRERRSPLVFGVPFLPSSHYFILRVWLRSSGLKPDRDVHFAVVPPPQMPANLKAGHLDGFCVGEPWNSVAIAARHGVLAATSADITPRHPEKVLIVRREFAEQRADEHERLIRALVEACRFCAALENRPELTRILTMPAYVNQPAPVLEPGLSRAATGAFVLGDHEPSPDKAAWVLDGLAEAGLLPSPAPDRKAVLGLFRAEIFHKANQHDSPGEYAHKLS